MPLRYILMGDIIHSSQYDARPLRREFLRLIDSCNKALEERILSPYTVTLGDEFQGVALSLDAAIEAIFLLEESAFEEALAFKVRYVLVHGQIDTPVNRLKAHNMMGLGLTKARKILTDKRKGRPRFRFDLGDAYLTNQLGRLFVVVDGLRARWNAADAGLIADMLRNTNNEEVGAQHGKDRTQIWRRRKNLLIEEYRAVRDAITDLARER